MNTFKLNLIFAPALVLAGMLAFSPAMAEKPSWAGGGKGDKENRSDNRDSRGGGHDSKGGGHEGNERSSRGEGKRDHFEHSHRVAVHDYYDNQFRSGHCPPGLAKKHNGCMPPGQAKKWHMGQHLPREVVFYSVPQELVIQIGRPPSGYRYVRVDSDILLMSIATRMIVDSIQNLGRS